MAKFWLGSGSATFAAALTAVCAAGISESAVKLTARDGDPNDRFGWNVASSNLVAIVGMPFDDLPAEAAGSARAFRWDGDSWNQEQTLQASDGVADDHFGAEVAVSGDVALIGAAGTITTATGPGAAYAFRYDGGSWVEQQKLVPADGAVQDLFGASVALFGNIAVIGAPFDDDNGASSGSAYIFRYDGTSWNQEQKLVPSDGGMVELFGSSVAVHDDVVVVGSPWDDEHGEKAGSVYVFRFDGATWTQEAKLVPADAVADQMFGSEVATDRDVVVVGVREDADLGEASGAAYVFLNDGLTWFEGQKLHASDAQAGDEFGISVAVEKDIIAVGARHASSGGAVYIFALEGVWFEYQILTAPDASSGDNFGTSVSVVPGSVVIGAPDDNAPLDDEGSAYVFGIPCPADCANDDGVVGIVDFLELLAQWSMVGTSCDLDGGGVGITDFLQLLASHGPCP